MTSELKAVVVNEQTGELEYINVEDFVDVDTSGVAHEVEIVAVDEFRQIRQIRGDRNSTSTTQSITKPIAVTAGSAGSTFQHHHHLGSGGNIRSTPSLLRNSRSSGARSHGSSSSSSAAAASSQGQFLQVQNASNGSFFIPMVQDGTTVETSYTHQIVHAPSILPPASAQFIRAVEATATAGGSSEGGTQLVVFNGETSNFDVIPQDGNQNLQLRLCQVVNEDGDDGNGNTIYICEEQPGFNQDSNEYPNIQIVDELPMPILQDADGNVYEVEEFHHHGFSNDLALHFPAAKRRKKATRNGSTTKDGQTKVPKRPVNELKCLEVGCGFAGVNVSELRKHLTSVHFMSFDEEVLHFTSEKEFKAWRETYERERMVSFIFRGGTKKISRDQAVTYLICHRSGHYKPTMKDQSLRKRKMKPQGSCKMNGYCTAGIKLLKNLESGDVKCEICHTHYGHPLDSGAIPHLRVNNMLRKIIWKKFEEGMSFNQVVQYLHHNPDQLEGLRLLDRRAVRNIYDKFKKNPGRSFLDDEDYDDTLSPSNFNDGDSSMDVKSPVDLQQQDQKPSLVSVQMDFPSDSADDSKIPTFTLYQVPTDSSQDDEESNQNLILVSTIDTTSVTMEDITDGGNNVTSVVIDNDDHNVTTITALEGEERILAESEDLTTNDDDIQEQQPSNANTITKVAKKRGRKPKVKVEQLEEQPQSPVDVELDHDPFFDRSDNGSLGGDNGSPIRRSQRERKRKLFHDEEEKKNIKMRNTAAKIKSEPLEVSNEKRKDKSPSSSSTSGPSFVLVGSTPTTTSTPLKPVEPVTTTRNNDKSLSPAAAASSSSFISIASDEDEDKLSPPTLLKFDSEKTVPSPASTSSSGGGKLDLDPPVLEKIQCDNEHNDNADRDSQMTEAIICDDDTAITTTTTTTVTTTDSSSDNVNKIIEEASWASDEDVQDNDDNWNPPASLKPKKSMAKTKKVARVPSKATRLSSSSVDTELQPPESQKMLNAHNNTTTNLPFNIQDCISDEVKSQIQDLLQHGESGPTVLMYKKFGILVPEYGPKDLPFRKEDFCLVIQTPVQRQLMQQFSDVVYIDGHKGRQKDLKLMFVMVLDEFREAIPVAWLISNATDDRMVSIFLRVLKDHCGCDMQTYYLMAPINSNYCRIWSSVFYPKEDKNNLGIEEEEEEQQQEQLPQMILNEEDTKRDMRIEVAEIFADSVTRKKLNSYMHSMMYAVDQDTIDSIYAQMKDYLESEHGDKGREFLYNFEKNWIDKAPQWSLIYRIASPTNTLYVSESFGKLKKFIAFKGTKILSSVIDPVLKIGYDKCFSRSKRLFKGDQKLMKTQDDIAMFHHKSTEIPPECFQPKISVCARIIDDGNNRNEQDLVDSDNAWVVVDPENDAEHTVIDLKSPCRCRFICTKCDVCVHKYMCSCPQSQVEHQMCPHIHFVHSQLRFRDKKIKWIPVSASSITGHGVDDVETIVIEAIQEADD